MIVRPCLGVVRKTPEDRLSAHSLFFLNRCSLRPSSTGSTSSFCHSQYLQEAICSWWSQFTTLFRFEFTTTLRLARLPTGARLLHSGFQPEDRSILLPSMTTVPTGRLHREDFHLLAEQCYGLHQTVQEGLPHTAFLKPYHDSSIVRHPLNFLVELSVSDNPVRDSTRSVRSSDVLVQQKPFPPSRVNAISSVLRLHPPSCQLPSTSFPYTKALLASLWGRVGDSVPFCLTMSSLILRRCHQPSVRSGLFSDSSLDDIDFVHQIGTRPPLFMLFTKLPVRSLVLRPGYLRSTL